MPYFWESKEIVCPDVDPDADKLYDIWQFEIDLIPESEYVSKLNIKTMNYVCIDIDYPVRPACPPWACAELICQS